MLFVQKSTSERIRRRNARLARWNRPIGGTGDRIGAWVNALFVDHGILRLFFRNRHRVTAEAWRSAQPLPWQIAGLAKQGIRTIINLRGPRETGSFPLEVEACARHGIALVEIAALSREAPAPETIRALAQAFNTIQYPVLIHCKAGADRAGLVSALYLILQKGMRVDAAMAEMSLRHGHWRWSKTGVLDDFLLEYRDQGEAKGLPLLQWIETGYDPEALNRNFRPHAFSSFVTDKILRRE